MQHGVTVGHQDMPVQNWSNTLRLPQLLQSASPLQAADALSDDTSMQWHAQHVAWLYSRNACKVRARFRNALAAQISALQPEIQLQVAAAMLVCRPLLWRLNSAAGSSSAHGPSCCCNAASKSWALQLLPVCPAPATCWR